MKKDEGSQMFGVYVSVELHAPGEEMRYSTKEKHKWLALSFASVFASLASAL
jgi:hypothetical protein